jgi:nicotinamide phosphoribosyltransferase
MNSGLLTDGYKLGHIHQYPKGTEYVYSNLTARSLKHAPKGIEKVTVAGSQMAVIFLKNHFQDNFFRKPKNVVCKQLKEEISAYLGSPYDVSHFEKLHDLGYLPIEVKSLAEGQEVNPKIPFMTIQNTEPEFFWITNFLETIISSMMWIPVTSATIATQYKRVLTKWAKKTDKKNLGFVDFQGHDFSMRGMAPQAAMLSGVGHAFAFRGSDTLPVIHALDKYYFSKNGEINSVNATEHSVMCAGTKEDELGTFKYLMEQFPTGILSIVSDTWDLWKVITEILPQLKDDILARDGKIVIRPDSGDPVDIICGSLDWSVDTTILGAPLNHDTDMIDSEKGVIQLLWEIFGGTTNEQGYRVLDSHIGAIYGDSITLDRAEEICKRLEAKGFASTNIVLGIGSYTYQYNTRDTFGMAVKATSVVVNGERRSIFKDPATDDGTKKSARGLLRVDHKVTGEFVLKDECTEEEERGGELRTIFRNGSLMLPTLLEEVRQRVNENVQRS